MSLSGLPNPRSSGHPLDMVKGDWPISSDRFISERIFLMILIVSFVLYRFPKGCRATPQ